jgi:hypothetical protein
MPTLVGVFERPSELAQSIQALRGRGYDDLEFYSPAPFEEIDDAMNPKPSGVRIFTLVGGLLGVVIGGKPFASIPPYTVIAFELTILFGGLFTLVGLLVVGRLPSGGTPATYSPRFSAEEFGLVVGCQERDVAEIEALLRSHTAKEVTLVEP